MAKVLSSSVSMGTSRTSHCGYEDHLQGETHQPAGHSAPARTVKGKSPVTMGYHVTSGNGTPSSNMDLKKRP